MFQACFTHRDPGASLVFGDGSPAVVIEPSFGGSAREWRSIAKTLAAQTTVVTYDRAPYGASSRAADRRTPADIAADLHAILPALGVRGPIVLAGFSVGALMVITRADGGPTAAGNGSCGMASTQSRHGFRATAVMSSPHAPTMTCTRATPTW